METGADGYETTTSPDEFVESESTHSVDLELPGAATVEGTVTDALTGATIENANLTLVYPSGEEFTFEKATEGDGSFAVAEVPAIDDEFTLLVSATVDEGFGIANETAFNPAITTTQNLMLGPEYEGDGIETSPYEIHDAEDLQQMRYNLTAHYELQDDIDASGTSDWFGEDGFDPIGDFGDEFNGSFHGNGHTIENLTIDRETENNVGLFGAVESAGTLENVSLENVDIVGDTTVGGLAGETGGEVRNISVTGTVSGTGGFVGGLTGLNFDGEVVDVTTSADVEGASFVGGLVGESQDEIRSVTVSGDVAGEGNVGGLIGNSVTNSNITDAVATGTVNGTGEAVGGLVGLQVDGVITRSTATGSVNGDLDTGGLVGQNNGALITESTATGDVAGNEFGTGGLVGWNNGGTVSNASASGNVEGNEFVGGLIGENMGTVTASYAVGAVDDEENADVSGGLVGENSGDVTDSYWDVETTGQDTSDGSPDENGLTTDQMTGLNVTENMAAFEFLDGDGKWHVTDSYPALAWEDTDPFFGVNITETNSPVVSGETLTVTTTVTNWADDGTQTVTLTDTGFADEQQDDEVVTLDSGESAEGLTFEWETDESDGGTGAVTVASENHTDSVSVEIGDPVVTNVDTGEQYVTVQGAIDAANAGETLEIETGTFEQSFEIDESLTLRGQGSGDDGTTLEADSGTIAEITAVGVTVENLVMNGASGGETAIDVASGATDTTVQHVSFEGFETPIVVFGDDADIRENELDGAGQDGIALGGVDGATVENNTVTDSGRYGIFLEDSQAVVVSDNDLVDNGDGEYRELYPRDEDEIDGPADSGIALWETTHSTVEANTMTGNNRFGISAVQSSHNEYLDNVVEVDGTNKGGGIHLGVDSSENTISGSTITVTSGTVSVDWDSNLIYVVTGENNLVTDNELDGERTRGIFIQLSSNAVVENNTIAGLYGHGIQIDQRDYLADPSLGFYAANPGPATVANNSLEDVAVETKEFSSSDVGASGLYLYSDHAVETRNNTGTESGPDIQIGLSEQSVENQSITTSAGETTMSFEGEGQVDGLEEQPNPERPEGLASTGYYFEIEDFVFENDRFDLATITYDASFENLEFAYDEAALMDDGTILPDTLSLWRFDGDEWVHIEDSAVDTDEQVITGNVTESGTVGVFGAGFADGDGSADAPFEIENWNHLDNVRHSLDANFTLGNELNASTDGYDDVASEIANDGGGFEPIGDSDDAFTGTFDGDGQTIAEFVIDRRGTGNDQGMFGMIGTDGTVTNLVMADVDVAGLNRVGGLVAENNGTITDVAITGTVEGSTNVAGVVGRNEGGLLERLDVDVAIESSSGPVGGLVGTNWGGTIRDSITRGDIEATGAWQGAGGAFSRLYDSSQISNVTALGNVTQSPDGASQDSGAGGFASLATSSAEINDSIAEGDVDAEGRAGGFIGRLSGTVTNSAASGTVTGGGEVGGFVGESSGSLSTVFATGEVIGVDEVGGLVGKNDNGDISESYATGNVTGNYDVAGLVGVNEGEVSESYATGGVDEDESASTTGGLVADNHGTVTNSYWDTESTGQTSSAGSPDEYGLTTAEMTGLSVTENMEGFVFPNSEGTWHVTDSYPALAWEDTDPFFGVNITETNSPIEAGTVLNVTAELTNWAADGEQTVTLSDTEFSDGEQDFQSVALDSGQDEELILEWETETSNVGTGDVTVASENDTDRAAVTIEAVVETIDAQVTDDNATADGEDTVTFTVSVEDADTNPIEGLTIEVLDSEDVNELGGIEPGDTNQTDESGETTFTANSTDIGQFTVEFEEQQNENAATATATFVAGTPANISFDADPTDETVTADGAAAITYTVTVEDGFENPVEGVDVEADATAGSDVELNDDGETTTATTNADGEVTVAATSTTAQEAVEITFTEQDESNNATGSATFEVGAPDQIDAEVTVDNAVADGDDEVEFTVTITDANDNPIEDATVDVSDDAGLDDLAVEQETNPDGEAVFTATSTDSGAFTVTFSEDDAGEDTATATFVAGAPGQIDAEVSVDNAVANGEDAVEFTVTVTDDSANPVEGATVTVGDSEDVGDLGSIDAGDDAETDADGQVTFTATSTEPGAFTVAFSEDDAGTDTATATFVALEGGVDTLDIAGEGEQAVIASGTDHPISAEVSNEADIAGEFEVTLTIETETAVELRETVNTTALEPGENETVTFSNVTPELDILGMTESYGVTVSAGGANATGELVVNPDVTGNGEPARDVTGDGLFDNVNGDREDGEDVVNIADVQALFQNLDNPTLQEFAPRFNFAGANPDRVTVFDVQGLFTRLTDLGD